MKTIDEAVAARDKFLEEHPHLKPFQEKLDQELEGLSLQARMERLGNMMNGNLMVLGALPKVQ